MMRDSIVLRYRHDLSQKALPVGGLEDDGICRTASSTHGSASRSLEHKSMPLLISVITPVYNVDHDLFQACADSILSQSYERYEWLVIDDGSEPAYADWLDAYLGSVDKAVVFHIQNQGPSAARNVGLAEAHGDAVLFIDADDRAREGYFEHAVELMQSTNADIAMGCIVNVMGGSPLSRAATWNVSPQVFEGDSLTGFKRFSLARVSIRGSVKSLPGVSPYTLYPKLFKREVLDGLRFDEQISYAEDTLLNLAALERSSRVVATDEVWYERVINDASITHPTDPRVFESQLSGMRAYLDPMDRYHWNRSDVGMRFLQALLSMVRDCSLRNSLGRTCALTRELVSLVHEELSWIDAKQYDLSRGYRMRVFLVKARLVLPLVLLVKKTSAKTGYLR